MKRYYAMTIPMQKNPKSAGWEMFVVFKDDVTGQYSSKKVEAKTLGDMNGIRAKLLESTYKRENVR